MHEQRYGLVRRPFAARPTGAEVFIGPQTAKFLRGAKKALAVPDAAIVVTGPAGVGKTTLVNRALAAIELDHHLIRITRLTLQHDEVLEYLLDELDAVNVPASTIKKIALFKRLLFDRQRSGSRVIIVIEDAARIGDDALTELESLTAADDGDCEGANLVLMGDEGFREIVNSSSHIRLKQRVRIFSRLEPLGEKELYAYLKHGFRVAGGDFDRVFAGDSALHLHLLTGGVPRIANTLIEAVLTAAGEHGLEHIDEDLITRIAADELGLTANLPPKSEAVSKSPPETTKPVQTGGPVETEGPVEPGNEPEPADDRSEPLRAEPSVVSPEHYTLPNIKILAPDLLEVENEPDSTEPEPGARDPESAGAEVVDEADHEQIDAGAEEDDRCEAESPESMLEADHAVESAGDESDVFEAIVFDELEPEQPSAAFNEGDEADDTADDALFNIEIGYMDIDIEESADNEIDAAGTGITETRVSERLDDHEQTRDPLEPVDEPRDEDIPTLFLSEHTESPTVDMPLSDDESGEPAASPDLNMPIHDVKTKSALDIALEFDNEPEPAPSQTSAASVRFDPSQMPDLAPGMSIEENIATAIAALEKHDATLAENSTLSLNTGCLTLVDEFASDVAPASEVRGEGVDEHIPVLDALIDVDEAAAESLFSSQAGQNARQAGSGASSTGGEELIAPDAANEDNAFGLSLVEDEPEDPELRNVAAVRDARQTNSPAAEATQTLRAIEATGSKRPALALTATQRLATVRALNEKNRPKPRGQRPGAAPTTDRHSADQPAPKSIEEQMAEEGPATLQALGVRPSTDGAGHGAAEIFESETEKSDKTKPRKDGFFSRFRRS